MVHIHCYHLEKKRMAKELYQWQRECLEKWFENKGRGMVQAVTGTGKTFLALRAADRLDQQKKQKLRVKIVVPTGELMKQWERALREYLSDFCGYGHSPGNFSGVIGLRGSGHKPLSDCKYMIYVINSARYELARQILAELRRGETILLIADECHHYVSEQNRLIFEFLPHLNKEEQERFFSMGLSATLPSGQERHNLETVLGKKIYSYGMAEASAHNTVSKYDIYHIDLSLSADERDEYEELSDQMLTLYKKLLRSHPYLQDMGLKERFEELKILAGDKDQQLARTALQYMQLTYMRRKLVCLASERTACACDLIKNLSRDERIIIFGERIRQAEELFRLLQRHGFSHVGRYHSQMGQQANKNVIERFRAGELRILIACKALDEGLDVPEVSVGIILSGTSVRRQRTQRMGRIIRRNEGKSRASLYYLHISGTMEDVCFLPDTGDGRVFDLSYDPDGHSFLHPAYDDRAKMLLAHLYARGVDARKIREAERCLRLGGIRSDWLLKRPEIEKRIREEKYAEDKNYWICMKGLNQGIRSGGFRQP